MAAAAQETPAELENRARLTMMAIAWWRPTLALETANTYWRDVHGVLDARLPGLWGYKQLHCDPVPVQPFPAIPGVEQAWAGDDSPEAVATLLFLDEEALRICGESELALLARQDNLELVERNIHYLVADAACTWVDRTGDAAPQGPALQPTYVVFVRRRPDVAEDDFHAATRVLAERWSADPGVLRLRLQALGRPEGQHPLGPEHLHDALIELVVADEAVCGRLVDAESAALLGRVACALNTVQAREVYAILVGGRPTQVGLRGWAPVQAIRAMGARIQEDERLLELLYGPVVHGA